MQDSSRTVPQKKTSNPSAASETHITVDDLGLKYRAAMEELAALKESERVRAVLFSIFDEASSSDDLKTFCSAMHRTIKDLMHAENAFIAAYDAASRTLHFPYVADEKDPEPASRGLGKGLTDFVVRSGEPFRLSEPGAADALAAKGFGILGTKPSDWLGVPLRSGKDLIGVLAVQSYTDSVRFGAREKDVLLDISRHVATALERKLAQDRLRDSEHRNRAMLQAIPDIVFVLSRDGFYLDLTAAKKEDLALPPSKVIGSHIRETGFSPEHLEQFGQAIEKTITTGVTQQVYYDLVTPKGPGHWEARVARLDNDRALAIVRDVTEQRKAEQAVRTRESNLRRILENLPVGVWLTDRRGIITYGNTEVNRIWAGARLVGVDGYAEYKAWWPATGKCVEPHEWASARARQEGHSILNEEMDIETFDGARKTILNSAIPLRDERGEIEGTLIVNEDITARKQEEDLRSRLEAQMLQAQKLESLGILAGGIAHDFNNLLVGILGNADLALMDVSPDLPAREHIEDIKKAAIRASELTNQMLAYSGKGRFVIDLIDLNMLIRETSHLLQVSISKRAVLKYNFTENLPAIEGDPTQIRQVIMNLITNASDAIGERSGIISVSTGVVEADPDFFADAHLNESLAEGYYTYVEVADTGSGMDEATLKKVFDPFFTTKFTGRGLGLAAVLGIARGHRGAIKVRSTPGKGSTFRVFFPCAAEATKRVARDDRPQASLVHGHGTILVVDDEESVRNIAKIMLERHGFTVITALDGRDGVRVFSEHADRIDAVVLDMTMPHMGGEEAFAQIQKIKPGARVLLASGYTEQDTTNRFSGRGLAGFVHKPFQMAEFIQKVAAIIPARPSGGAAG
ncbi:MAG: PAS domain-containing protein [bacterium]